jgi:hypothetical protein
VRKIDWSFALVGLTVAGLLTWYAYYSSSHREAKKISELVYLVLFPPSIGLMVTENATVAGQVIIVSIVVAANGVLYGLVSMIARNVFK